MMSSLLAAALPASAPQLQQPAAEGKMNDKVSKLKKAAAKKNPAEMSEEEIEAAMSEEKTKLNME